MKNLLLILGVVIMIVSCKQKESDPLNSPEPLKEYYENLGNKLVYHSATNESKAEFTHTWMNGKKSILRVGEVWENKGDPNVNPFKNPKVLAYDRLIDIKGYYVQFIRNEEETLSMKCKEFLITHRRIKKVDETLVINNSSDSQPIQPEVKEEETEYNNIKF
jgi:hypothetical protein